MKKPVKITLIGVAMVVGAIIVALALVPVLLEDRIIERLRTELNEQLHATVTFSDVDASLLSTFPTLTAEISALKVTGEGEFEGITLFSAESVAAGVDLIALVMDDAIQIESIGIDHPEAHLIVTEDWQGQLRHHRGAVRGSRGDGRGVGGRCIRGRALSDQRRDHYL